MRLDNACHVIHATIAYFDRHPVEKLMVSMMPRKVLVNKTERLFSQVGLNVCAERRVKPNDLTPSVPGLRDVLWFELQLTIKPTVFKRLRVRRFAPLKLLLTTRNS